MTKRKTQMKKGKGVSDSLRFQISFFEELLAGKPDYLEALIALGHAYTQAGFYEKGLAVDRRLVRLKPEDGIVRYNLACSYALLGKRRSAVEALKKAFELGYRDWEHMETDPDLDDIRNTKTYKNLVVKCKEFVS